MSNIGTAVIAGTIDGETRSRVLRLFSTPAGTVPFDRNFGIDLSLLDNPKAVLEGALCVEYARKLKAYFPDLYIADLTFSYSDSGDRIIPKITIAEKGAVVNV